MEKIQITCKEDVDKAVNELRTKMSETRTVNGERLSLIIISRQHPERFKDIIKFNEEINKLRAPERKRERERRWQIKEKEREIQREKKKGVRPVYIDTSKLYRYT